MTWHSPFWLILGFPLLAAAALLLWRAKARVPKGRSFLHLVPAEGRWAMRSGPNVSHRRPWFLFLAGLLLILSLAGPQWGQGSRQFLRPSTDVIIALDLSRSMTAADLAPSRLDRAKLLIRTFLGEASGQRLGLLVFSSSAQLAVPLTTDYRAIEELLGELTPASLPEAGTDFTALMDEACDTFSQSDAAHRILLILSDGEDHGSGWKERLPRLMREGVRAYAIGLGTDRGGLIPDPKGGFLKDDGGHPVLSRLQPDALRALSSATGGRYFRGDRWVTLSEIFGLDSTADSSRLERTVGRTERFAYFLLPAVLCWGASLLWELPTLRSVPRVRPPGPPSAQGSRMPIALLLGMAGVFSVLRPSSATAGTHEASSDGAKDELVRCVDTLAGKERLSASDCGDLAHKTISWCRSRREEELSPGVIQDGLAAVDQGERLDSRRCPWAQMREELEAFRKAAQPPDSASEDALSLAKNRGANSPKPLRFRPSAGGRSLRSGSDARPNPPSGASSEKGPGPPPPSSSGPSEAKSATESQSRPSPPADRNGARARLRQVERLDRPALLFERMRQKDAEQVDAPPEPMDW